MTSKNLISIDTSTELCSISIQYKNKIHSIYKYSKKENSKYLILLIYKTINKYNINIKKINFIILNKGPGSIIGTRISYLIAKTINLFFNKIKLWTTNTQSIISENYFNIKKKDIINIIIYNDINNIYNFIYKNNIKVNTKIIIYKKINLYLKKLNKNIKIIVNNFQLKNKILFIIKKYNINLNRKIKIIYPKSKYIISIFNKINN